jgi:hypothetical protein
MVHMHTGSMARKIANEMFGLRVLILVSQAAIFNFLEVIRIISFTIFKKRAFLY